MRACVSAIIHAIGSQPGLCPSRLPVSQSDQGAYCDGQNASPLGRTCTKTALWLSFCARSSQLRYSALTCASGRPFRLGQSMLLTEVIHMARSSRGADVATPPQEPAVDALAVAVKMARSRRGSVRGPGRASDVDGAADADARLALRAAVDAAQAR